MKSQHSFLNSFSARLSKLSDLEIVVTIFGVTLFGVYIAFQFGRHMA